MTFCVVDVRGWHCFIISNDFCFSLLIQLTRSFGLIFGLFARPNCVTLKAESILSTNDDNDSEGWNLFEQQTKSRDEGDEYPNKFEWEESRMLNGNTLRLTMDFRFRYIKLCVLFDNCKKGFDFISLLWNGSILRWMLNKANTMPNFCCFGDNLKHWRLIRLCFGEKIRNCLLFFCDCAKYDWTVNRMETIY